MTRYVIEADVALWLAERRAKVPAAQQWLAPTLMRSQVLSRLYGAVQAGHLARREADERLDHLRGLKIRLLGDRVLQGQAWKVAALMGWPDTERAEYVALTQLQGDAMASLDAGLPGLLADVIKVVPPEALLGG